MTLSDLLRRLGDVEETPDGFLVHCPAHKDSHQSLRLAVSDQGKVLMRCRAGCATSDVVKALGLTMRDLATMTPGDLPAPRVSSVDAPAGPAEIAALAVRLDGWAAMLRASYDLPGDAFEISTPPGAQVAGYASERFGIGRDDVERLGLGCATDLPGGTRLVVPFRDRDGVARGFQARALEKDAQVRWLGPKNPEGATWSKIGYFPGSSGWDEILVCEGPGDALTGVGLGYDTIGIRGAGLVSNPAVVEQVAEWIGDREAVIAGDGDPAGRRFSATLAEALAALDVRVRILAVPEGLDLTDWRKRNAGRFAQEVVRAIAEAPRVKSRTAALLAWDEERYSLTDLGGARYLRDYVASLGSGVRYTEEIGFSLLENGVWRRDDRQQVRTYAQQVADLVKNLAAEAAQIAEETEAKEDKARAGRLRGYAKHAQTSRGLDAMLRELQAVDGVPANVNDFDQHPDLVACRNGVVNLRTGEIRPHDPALLLTRRIDLDYNPDAQAPRWERFLDEVFPAYPDLPAFIRRLVGYGITGHTTEQAFAVLWGTGANGKSVFTDTLTEVFRELTVTTPFSTFEERPSGGIPNDLAALKGARLVMASEGEAGKRMAEAVLKRVTGRDLISARFMRKEFFEFRPTFLLMLATNSKPNFRGQDEGLWRRVKLIPWERYFKPEERDHRLGERLLAEGEGIFAWAVRGAQEWYREGLKDPEVIRDATKEYRETSDVLNGFLPGVYVPDPTAETPAKDVFHDFQTYADEGNYLDLKKWSNRALYMALEERGYARKTGTGNRLMIEGIRKARPSEHHVAAEKAQTERAAESPLALSSTDSTPSLAGADLDSL